MVLCFLKINIYFLGLAQKSSDGELEKKFKHDVIMAEKLTGGNMEIFKELEENSKRKNDYAELGFGIGVKKRKDENRKQGSDIKQIVSYKKGMSNGREIRRRIEHITKILEQPLREMTDEEQQAASRYNYSYFFV